MIMIQLAQSNARMIVEDLKMGGIVLKDFLMELQIVLKSVEITKL